MTMTSDGASRSPASAELMEHQPDLGSYVFWTRSASCSASRKGDVGIAYLEGGVLLDFRSLGDGQ